MTKKTERLRELCERATKGPWWQWSHKQQTAPTTPSVELSELLCFFDDEGNPRFWDWENDGEFVASSRTALPELLDLVEKLHEELKICVSWLNSEANGAPESAEQALSAYQAWENGE